MSRTMKDSGIEWIGDVPEEWEVKPIKYIKSKEKNSFADGPFGSNLKSEHFVENGDVLVIESGFITTGKFIYKDFKTITKEHFETIKRSECKAKDIIIAKIGANYGMSGELPLLHKPSVVSGNSLKITLDNKKYLNSIFVFAMMTAKSNKGFLDLVQENAQPALSLSGLNNFKLPSPPLAEQHLIATFLDKKCSEIDSLIDLQEQMIEELKAYKQSVITEAVTKGLNPNVPMKDSGIEWIGEIPEGWEVKRLKQVLSLPLQYGANESGIPYQEGLTRYVRITDILDNSLKNDIEKQSLTNQQAEGYILRHNDILFARSGGTVGKSFIFSEKYGLCAFAGYLIKARVNELMEAKFVYYFTQTNCYDEWKKQIFIQSTIQNIGADRYSQLQLPIPPLTEQQAIADYLDKKCGEIDELITIKQQKIESLKEYKKSVIYEYVTGKREV